MGSSDRHEHVTAGAFSAVVASATQDTLCRGTYHPARQWRHPEETIVRRLSILVIALTLGLTGSVFAQDSLRLTGSGATFPFPIYSAWFKAFSGKNKGTTVDYQGKGSGAGIQDFLNRTVDFAASDAAMTD